MGNMAELQSAIQGAVPGDVIIMADGIWKDATINFHAEGKERKERKERKARRATRLHYGQKIPAV